MLLIGRRRKPAAERVPLFDCNPLSELSPLSGCGLCAGLGTPLVGGGAMERGCGVAPRLPPSRGKPKRVAPPVGLAIVGRLTFPAKIVGPRRKAPDPAALMTLADPCRVPVGSASGTGEGFNRSNRVLWKRAGEARAS